MKVKVKIALYRVPHHDDPYPLSSWEDGHVSDMESEGWALLSVQVIEVECPDDWKTLPHQPLVSVGGFDDIAR